VEQKSKRISYKISKDFYLEVLAPPFPKVEKGGKKLILRKFDLKKSFYIKHINE